MYYNLYEELQEFRHAKLSTALPCPSTMPVKRNPRSCSPTVIPYLSPGMHHQVGRHPTGDSRRSSPWQ